MLSIFQVLSGISLTTSGLLFLLEQNYIFAGRVLFGVTYGLCHLTVIVHVSEIATKEMRSEIIRKIVYLIFLSIVLCSVSVR